MGANGDASNVIGSAPAGLLKLCLDVGHSHCDRDNLAPIATRTLNYLSQLPAWAGSRKRR